MVPSPPTNLLCRNLGDGSVELQFDASAGAVSYNIYMSTTIGGTYNKINFAAVTDTKSRVPNLRFGATVFFKVTAVNGDGESAMSTVAQDAVCSPGVCTLQFTGMVGDTIPVGAMFTAPVNGRLVSFVVTTEGICA